jgi:hypothetical protein
LGGETCRPVFMTRECVKVKHQLAAAFAADRR